MRIGRYSEDRSRTRRGTRKNMLHSEMSDAVKLVKKQADRKVHLLQSEMTDATHLMLITDATINSGQPDGCGNIDAERVEPEEEDAVSSTPTPRAFIT